MHSSNKALIIGTGFGSLYKGIYENLGWQVTTIDIADPKKISNPYLWGHVMIVSNKY